MEKKFTDEMKVGLFVFSAIICIIFFIFTQTRIGKWAGYEIGVLFDFVSGLEIGSPVRVSGVRVGEVKKIEIIYQETPKVFVKLKIHPTVRIGRNSRFTIRTLGLIGEKYIEIVPSKGEDFIKKGEIVEGENPLSVEKIANMGEEIATNLNKVLSDISKITGDKKFQQSINEVLENTKLALVQINNSFSKIDNLVEDISQTNKNINSFIEENSPGIKKVIENTNSFLVSGKKEIEETMASIRNFTTVKDKLETAILSFSDTSESFKETSIQIKEFFEKIEKEGLIAKIMKEEQLIEDIKEEILLLQDATNKLKDTTLKIGETSEKLSMTLENVNAILKNIREGKGTVGKFISSDELYNEALNFIKEIRENPWRLFFRRR